MTLTWDGTLMGRNCFAYIDDIVIFGDTLDHNKNLELRIKKLELKLEPTKCEYLNPELH